MKTPKLILSLVLFLGAQAAFPQTKVEMPLSGSTPEINKMLRDAWALMADGKAEEGRELLKKIRTKDPDFALAHLYATANDPDKERENIARALTLRMNGDEKQLIEGRKASLEKKLTNQFDGLLKKFPGDKQVGLLIAWHAGGDAKRRVELCTNLIKKFPDYAAAYNLRGYGYMTLNEMQKAAADFDKYISLEPDLANPYDSKAEYFMKAGKIEEAILLYEKAAKMDSKNMANSQVKAENAKNKLYGFKVPERTAVQKHNRMVSFTYNGIIAGIAHTKKSGGTTSDYGKFCGDLYKTGWNRAGGFEGFVRGALFNFESLRRESDPPIEIIQQDNNSIQFKWKANYRGALGDTLYGVTFEDITEWNATTYAIIGEYLGATYEQEVMADDRLKITIKRKTPI